MIDLDDYRSYMMQNFNFIELLRDNNSPVIARLEDVTKVLGFIEEMASAQETIEEEFEVIFEAGFAYFHEQLEEIKIYYHRFFQKDYLSFKRYETLINYNLYLGDLKDVLVEQKMLTDELDKEIKSLSEEIEDFIDKKRAYDAGLFDSYDARLAAQLPRSILTTQEIYALIAEELEI